MTDNATNNNKMMQILVCKWSAELRKVLMPKRDTLTVLPMSFIWLLEHSFVLSSASSLCEEMVR